MTNKEQETVDKLLRLVNDLRTENNKFREDIKLQVDAINTKTNNKHLPIVLEQDILRTTQLAIDKSIQTVLTAYDSPLNKLVKSVVDENSMELRKIISDSFSQVIKTDDFKQSIISGFAHKVARTIISNNDGLFDKVSNELKQDSIFKSKMSLAVANVVEECLQNKK
jgi:hypothetical protein